ncbi:phage tail protein [Salipiger sp. IMCC34102]|uniref:tail protein X n=1 Tax=Salipiger sp. IMCC34102 TaxID=2510647 RepID=UPI00101E22B3|nr:tail protein X [Salipiger sp. IMCC34102]RYH02829.1 phage tail protein [Salipiger sp. IMCC34102]
MSIYRTRDGDVVDAVAFAHYGHEDMVEAVFAANPGLAARGPVLPSGVTIVLPERPARPAVQRLRLWGRE